MNSTAHFTDRVLADNVRQRILATTDLGVLDRWVTQAATAATADEVIVAD